MKPSILIIYTGGTIGMKPDPTTGALVPFDFSGIFEEFPTLQSLNIGIEVFTMDPVIDSSNVSPRNWLDLAAIIRDNYARYDGFVVLHGTDTMSYTASALSFLLENLAKPVVFTGSQIPIGVLRTDGRENLKGRNQIGILTEQPGNRTDNGDKDQWNHFDKCSADLEFPRQLGRKGVDRIGGAKIETGGRHANARIQRMSEKSHRISG